MSLSMSIEDWIKVIAGTFVCVFTFLGYFVHQYWLFVTVFVGLNLFQFGFTKFCPLKLVLDKLVK